MLALVAILGAAGISAYGQPGSGKPYGARDVFVCKSPKEPAKDAPSPSQLKDYVRCKNDKIAGGLVLWDNVQVEIGKSRPYSSFTDSGAGDIDPSQPVYPIRGTADYYNCWIPHPGSTVYPVYASDAGKNCNVQKTVAVAGVCYQTTFSDWSCPVTRTGDVTIGWTKDVPPPK